MEWCEPLAKAAVEHARDLGDHGLTTVLGSGQTLPTERISKHCVIDEAWAESTLFGCVSAEEVVLQMVICDGHPKARGYRSTLFSKDVKKVGVGVSTHTKLDSAVVLTFAKGILSKEQTEKINYTVTDHVSQELVDKMKKMGIDTNRIKVIQDSSKRQTEQRVAKIFSGNKPQLLSKKPELAKQLSTLAKHSLSKQ